MRALHVAGEQQVELLVGAAELDVGLDRDRVVALQHRVEELERRDRLARRHPVGEVVALEDPGHGHRLQQLESSSTGMSSHSLLNRTSVRSRSRTLNAWSWKVAALASICSGESTGPLGGAAARVADPGGEVADDQYDGVPGLLELGQLREHDAVAEVDVGRGRVDAELDPQRPALGELLGEAALGQRLLRPGQELVHACVHA